MPLGPNIFMAKALMIYRLSSSNDVSRNKDSRFTSAFCSFPSSAKTAATALPFASLTAPNRFPAYAPTMRPGIFATMNPKPAPQAAPKYAHHGARL